MHITDIKCPICGTENHIADIKGTNGWMKCENCENDVQLLEYAETKRIPCYQMRECQIPVSQPKKYKVKEYGDAGTLDDLFLVLPEL